MRDNATCEYPGCGKVARVIRLDGFWCSWPHPGDQPTPSPLSFDRSEPSEPGDTVEPMRTCIHCGATDQDTPLVVIPVHVDGRDAPLPVTVCNAHFFTPFPA